MKKRLFASLLITGLLLACYDIQAQDNEKSEKELSLRREIEATKGNSEKLKEYIKVMGVDNDATVRQFDLWMKQYPDSASFPFAIGEAYYSHESPKATPYLKKVSELTPFNSQVWTMLAIDAERWGENDLAREYNRKAAEADPNSARLAYTYAYSFKNVDKKKWEKLSMAVADKFPNDPNSAACMSMLAYGQEENKQKIAIYEELARRFKANDNIYAAVAFSRLIDSYIIEREFDKAISVAQSVNITPELVRLGFAPKLKLAQELKEIRKLQSEKNYAEAYKMSQTIVTPRESFIVPIIKAEVADQAGFTQRAYDSLLVAQAKRPTNELEKAIVTYGSKLGKSLAQQKSDLKRVRDSKSWKAPAFDLGLYTSDKKVRLEDYKGKVIFMTFWFPGCGPCRGEMPHLEAVLKKYPKDKVVYLGVQTVPDQDTYVLPFMKGTRYSFTPLHGTPEMNTAYKVRANPANFIIDQNGQVQYSDFMIGDDDKATLEMMMQSVLETE